MTAKRHHHHHHLIIGSRGSALALWQAHWVEHRLAELHPEVRVTIEIVKTTGDVLKHAPLSMIGGRGVFTKELEEALLNNRIDIAVHSLKDLPTTLSEHLTLAAITEREDSRDAIVIRSNAGFDETSFNEMSLRETRLATLPEHAVVGTSSPRRLAQLKHLRADLNVKELRGNVDTRLRKLDEGEYDAIVLAAAGLHRLERANRIAALLAPEAMLPAVGQGALGIETRRDDATTIDLLRPLNHTATRLACTAERALLRSLGGGCQLPIAAYARVLDDTALRLDGLVAETTGRTIVRSRRTGRAVEAAQVGEQLADELLRQGAAALLAGAPV